MNILVTLNSGYLHQLAVMLTSLATSTKDTNFDVYVAHSTITTPEFATLRKSLVGFDIDVISVPLKHNFLNNAPITGRYPLEMYYRIFAAQFLPETLDRILYLDPDLVVINNITELYNIDFQDNLMAAASHVKEPLRKFNELRLSMPEQCKYINSGILMLNLELLRKTQDITQVLEYIEKYRRVLLLPDQDIMSAIYGDKILGIDHKIYNMTDRELLKLQLSPKNHTVDFDWVEKNTVVVHYCGKNKPWRRRYIGSLGVFYDKYNGMIPKNLYPTEKRERMLMLINPHAGQATIKNRILDIIDLFVKNNYEVTIRTTQMRGEIPQIIKEDSFNYDVLIACGGDGTLNECVTGLMQYNRNLLFGFIPAGTINDFASSIHIPKNDMLAAAQCIVNGKEFGCDIGVFDDKYFTYIAAFGAFTAVSYATPQDFKNLFGRAAYFLEGIASVPSIKSYHIKIKTPKSVIEDDFIFGMISNSISVSGFHITDKLDVALNDGLLEVLLVKKPKNPIELQIIINAILVQDLGCEYLYVLRCDHLELECQEKIAWTLDGEFGGNHNKVEINVEKQALKIIAPITDDFNSI